MVDSFIVCLKYIRKLLKVWWRVVDLYPFKVIGVMNVGSYSKPLFYIFIIYKIKYFFSLSVDYLFTILYYTFGCAEKYVVF